MEAYGFDDALVDLDALENGDLNGEGRAECVSRIRNLIEELNRSGFLTGDDQ